MVQHENNVEMSLFYRNNFLALDVYYGELRYELVEQLPLYQLENFFSK